MGRNLLLFLLWSAALLKAGAVDVALRGQMRRRKPQKQPKVGMPVEIVVDQGKYDLELERSGLMGICELGAKGKITELDIPLGEARIKVVGADFAWVPVRIMKGFENWCPPSAGCPPEPTTTTLPAGPSPAAPGPAPNAADLLAGLDAGPPSPAGATTTTAAGPAERMFGKTNYAFSSCRRTDAEVEDAFSLALGMDLNRCFEHCHKLVGMHYFAVSQTKCYCSSLPMGAEVSSDNCDSKCAANPEEYCGGAGFAASVHLMIDCDPPIADERLQMDADDRTLLIGAYSKFVGESCSMNKDLLTEVDGSSTMAGTPEDCKVACWKKKGGAACHGFTYDETESKCTFLSDVIHEEVSKKKSLTCYWKKVGYQVKKGLEWDEAL